MIAIGTRVFVDARYGHPAKVATGIVERFEPYRGQGGYRIRWDYGRPTEMYESSGGWFSASMIAGFAPDAPPRGLCERDAAGTCTGKCGRRGHLDRALTVEDWLSFHAEVR